ncbi:hypothetical protein ACE6H2_022248 [Prunus campanulata]
MEQAGSSSSRRKGKWVASSSSAAETDTSWPFKLKLKLANLCTDLLKLDPSKEFEEHIVGAMSEANRKLLEDWKPVYISAAPYWH